MKIVATIEARMTSSRLPGKVLLPALGRPILWHLIERLRQVASLNAIVIATTHNQADEPIVEFAKSNKIDYYRGSENDVMQRVIDAASSVAADVIVEITGDCPLIDPEIVEQAIRIFRYNNASYVGNAHVRSYPDGMDVQIFHLDDLKKSASLTQDTLEREHVTLHMRNNPGIFAPLHIVAPPALHWPELGLTLDEQADYQFLCTILDFFGEAASQASCYEIIELLKQRPELLEINGSVRRKGDT